MVKKVGHILKTLPSGLLQCFL